MPANLQRAVPVGVLPQITYLTFTEGYIFPMLVQQYKDGSTERSLITDGVNPAQSIQTWKLTARLTNAQVTSLRLFYEAHLGATIPFYFYDPLEGMPIGSNWSADGSTLDGLYAVRFTTTNWNTVTDVGLTNVGFELQEVDL
jgi:hypothetical protein